MGLTHLGLLANDAKFFRFSHSEKLLSFGTLIIISFCFYLVAAGATF